MNRVMGGAAFTTAPRAAFAVIQDADDPNRRLFLHLKNNLAPTPQGLAFRLEQQVVATDKTGDDIIASRVVWDSEPVDMTAEDALSPPKGGPTETDEATDFLRNILADGPKPVNDIQKQARAASLLREDQPLGQSKPFRSARMALGIKPREIKGVRAGGWLWALPTSHST